MNNTDKLYFVVVECLLYLFYHSKRYIFCLLSYSDSNALVHIGDFLALHEFCYFGDWICGFFVRGRPLVSSMNEKDIMCLVLIANPIINWCFFFFFLISIDLAPVSKKNKNDTQPYIGVVCAPLIYASLTSLRKLSFLTLAKENQSPLGLHRNPPTFFFTDPRFVLLNSFHIRSMYTRS